MSKAINNKKRALRVRSKLKKNNTNRYRLCVRRSSRNIFAQIIDNDNKTIISASSLKEKNSDKNKSDLSIRVANILSKRALEKKITKVYFDRGSYKYHGRIKIFAETLRKNGLNF